MADLSKTFSAKLESNIKAHDLQLLALNQRIQELTAAIEEKDKELKDFIEKSNSSTQSQQKTDVEAGVVMSQKLSEFEAEKEVLRVIITEEKSKAHKLQEQNNALVAREKEFQDSIEKADKRHLEDKTKSENELLELQKKLGLREKELDIAKEKMETTEKKEQNLAKELSQNETELKNERKKVEAEVQDKQSKIAAFESKERELQAKLKDTETQLQAKKEEYAAVKAEADLLKKMSLTPQNKPSSACLIQ